MANTAKSAKRKRFLEDDDDDYEIKALKIDECDLDAGDGDSKKSGRVRKKSAKVREMEEFEVEEKRSYTKKDVQRMQRAMDASMKKPYSPPTTDTGVPLTGVTVANLLKNFIQEVPLTPPALPATTSPVTPHKDFPEPEDQGSPIVSSKYVGPIGKGPVGLPSAISDLPPLPPTSIAKKAAAAAAKTPKAKAMKLDQDAIPKPSFGESLAAVDSIIPPKLGKTKSVIKHLLSSPVAGSGQSVVGIPDMYTVSAEKTLTHPQGFTSPPLPPLDTSLLTSPKPKKQAKKKKVPTATLR